MKEKNKILLKKGLISLTISLFVIWLGIFLYGLFIERPISINLEKSLGQIQLVDITKPMDVSLIEDIKKKDQPLDKEIKTLTEAPKETLLPQTSGEIKNTDQPISPSITPEIKKIEKVKIAIVLTNLGTNKDITEAALKLPKTISLGFLSTTSTLKPLFNQAIKAGNDVLIYLPLEPKDYPNNEPGPYSITKNNKPKKNLQIARTIVGNFYGIKGVYTSYKETFSSNQDLISPILEMISQKNLKIFFGRNIEQGPEFLTSNNNIIPADIVIDLVPDAEAIKHSLNNLISIAKAKGKAIGYFNTYPISISSLETWIKELSQEIELVPITTINN